MARALSLACCASSWRAESRLPQANSLHRVAESRALLSLLLRRGGLEGRSENGHAVLVYFPERTEAPVVGQRRLGKKAPGLERFRRPGSIEQCLSEFRPSGLPLGGPQSDLQGDAFKSVRICLMVDECKRLSEEPDRIVRGECAVAPLLPPAVNRRLLCLRQTVAWR